MATSSSSSSDLEVTVDTVSACGRRDEEWDPVVCCLRVPNRLLYAWHQTKRTSSYVQLLNDAVRGHVVAVDVHCERLERHLHRRAGDIWSKVARYRGRLRQRFLNDSTVFDVHSGETVDASELMEEMESMVTEDIAEWADKFEGARETISSLRAELQAARAAVSASSLSPLNTGLPLAQVSERQKRRKVSSLRESTEKALWFVESFGLSMESDTMRDQLSDAPLVLTYGEQSSPAPSYPPMPSDQALFQTLYLLERFGVSDEFYHELSIAHPSLPR